jgi:Tol biopolymer transport system component
MNPDTSELRKLEGQNTGEIDHLVWTPDGKSLLFNEVHGTNTNLYKMDVASGQLEALTQRSGTLRARSFSRDRTKVAYTFDLLRRRIFMCLIWAVITPSGSPTQILGSKKRIAAVLHCLMNEYLYWVYLVVV